MGEDGDRRLLSLVGVALMVAGLLLIWMSSRDRAERLPGGPHDSKKGP